MFIIIFIVVATLNLVVSQNCIQHGGRGCRTGTDCCYIPGRTITCEGARPGFALDDPDGGSKCYLTPLDDVGLCINPRGNGCLLDYDCCIVRNEELLESTCYKCVSGVCSVIDDQCSRPSRAAPLTCQTPPCGASPNSRVTLPSVPANNLPSSTTAPTSVDTNNNFVRSTETPKSNSLQPTLKSSSCPNGPSNTINVTQFIIAILTIFL